jgi:hypothetical protein
MTVNEKTKSADRQPEDAEQPVAYARAKRLRVGDAKAYAQMFIGLVTVIGLFIMVIEDVGEGGLGSILEHNNRGQLFDLVGYALAAAAVIELAYTLFTPGPDEALDPVALAVSAAILLQLGKAETFDLRQGAAAFLYVAALAGLFAIRKYLSELRPHGTRGTEGKR